jgi:hypothetical protein
MNKPHGMSRKDYHNMRAIVRDFLNDPSAIVEFSDSHTGIQAVGFQSIRHDEGFSSTSIAVSPGEKPGTYEVSEYNDGRDCDGRISSENEYLVKKTTTKRKRSYYSYHWETNRPKGKFGMKTAWKVLSKGKSRNRDYTAESMGY